MRSAFFFFSIMRAVTEGFVSHTHRRIPPHVMKPQIQFFVCKVLYDRTKAESKHNLNTHTHTHTHTQTHTQQ